MGYVGRILGLSFGVFFVRTPSAYAVRGFMIVRVRRLLGISVSALTVLFFRL